MILGVFCKAAVACAAMFPHQLVISGYPGVVYRDNSVVGAYFDDSAPGQVADANKNRGLTIAASPSFPNPSLSRSVLNPVEEYPITGPQSVFHIRRERAYALQAFSWSDNIQDDAFKHCHERCKAPDARQLRSEWCQAIATRPAAIFWYYADSQPGIARQIKAVERTGCPG